MNKLQRFFIGIWNYYLKYRIKKHKKQVAQINRNIDLLWEKILLDNPNAVSEDLKKAYCECLNLRGKQNEIY